MNRFEFYGNIEAYKRHCDELKHYGTIGQKWGVRKWQNPDGTFNEAGKERYFGTKGKKKSGSDDENVEQRKIGKFTLMPSVSKKMFDFGINRQRNALEWESTKRSNKNFADSIKENRDMYDAKNLTDEEIDDIVMNRMKTYTGETAAAEFNTQSLRYQLEKKLNTKFGSISKPKVKAKYINEDGTLNEEGKARVHAKANASATASAVFKILKWLKIAGMPITAISGISLAAMGAPATLVVAALAGLGIQGLGATGNHIVSKKLENRSSNYYKMLNGGNVNE